MYMIRLIIHHGHHKSGTLWFRRIIQELCHKFNLLYQYRKLEQPYGIYFLDKHLPNFDIDTLPSYVGSHMIRDPRDVIVSAYFYHKWSTEIYTTTPREQFNGQTYQEHINSISQNEGLHAEIEESNYVILDMTNWNYNNPNIYEIKYEDLIYNEQIIFKELFTHYEFSTEQIEQALQITESFSFENITGRKLGQEIKQSELENSAAHFRHLQNGKPSRWRSFLNKDHLIHLDKVTNNAVAKLGYEK